MSTQNTPRLYNRLTMQLRAATNEDEVRQAWIRAIEETLQITLAIEQNNKDLSYNNVVIEFKGPGRFNARTDSHGFREAIYDRLLPYIQGMSAIEHIDESDYIGIAIDDKSLAFAQVTKGQITHGPLLPITSITFAMVLEACRANYRRAITSANLIEDFGHDSERGRHL